MIIDWQHHVTPKEIAVRQWQQQSGAKQIATGSGITGGQPVYRKDGHVSGHIRPELYQLDEHLNFMDIAGIDIAVLSSLWSRNIEDCILVNDFLGNLIKKYPNRFVGLASCIPTMGNKIFEELDRAINGLGLKGVCIEAQTEGHELDSDILWPFYEKISNLNIPIFVHIVGSRVGYDAFKAKYNLWVTLGTMALDLSATARVILGGVLADFPDLKIVISHLGGGISAIKERFVRYIDAWGHGFWTDLGGTPPFGEPFGENFNEHFNRLYFDMAGYEGGVNAVKCALTTIKPERMLFGTDYPFNFTGAALGAKQYINDIKQLDLPRESEAAMMGGNAVRLLNI